MEIIAVEIFGILLNPQTYFSPMALPIINDIQECFILCESISEAILTIESYRLAALPEKKCSR